MLTRAIAFVAAGVAELGKLVDPNSAYPPDYERDGQRGLENGGVAPQSLQMQTGGRNETTAVGSYRYARAKRTLYTREYQLRVCPALNDEVEPVMVAQHHQKTTVAASLAYTGDSLSLGNRNASVHMERERVFDIRDIDIDLSTLLSQANRVSDENDDDSVQTIEGGNRAILIELAIVVIDPLWSTDQVYFRITVQNVAPRCSLSTHVFGNHEAIVVRSATAASSSSISEERQQHKQQAPPHGVSCKANRSSAAVDGWCLQCGLEPTAFPLYQTVLSDDELVKFAEEICAANGTHDHVLHTTPNNDMLEVQSVSTIARLVGAKNRQAARPEIAVVDPLTANSPVHGTGVTFVEREAWCAEVAEARRRFLGNLPLSDLSRAKIRIGARGSPSVGAASIGIILTAQTMEFVQQGATL